MRFTCHKPSTEIDTELVALGLWKDQKLGGLALQWDRRLRGLISRTLKQEQFKCKTGETRLLTMTEPGIRCLLLVGLGTKEKATSDLARRLGALAVQLGNKVRARRIAVEIPLLPKSLGPAAQWISEGAVLGNYSFDRYKSENISKKTVEEVRLLGGEGLAEGAVTRGRQLAEATNFARDLVNTPASDMTPARLVEEARKIGKLRGLSVRILDRQACAKLGMGGFLAVAKGSEQPPYLIHLTYRPAGKRRETAALVGKGVTFDSGGLSLKTAQGMETMKYDMSGAAAVLAVMRALAELRPPVAVHGIAAVTENMPSGAADKPGDIARTLNGKTIEILNTDAEGRLTLADAIPYAIRQKPDFVIDLATLTGACVVALGERCSGIMGNDQKLIDRLTRAGKEAGETLWQLPMVEEYREEIRSTVADLKNVGGKSAGTITAALFLEEFVTPKVPWAHIDMAGPCWAEKETELCPRGATGALVRTLCQFLLHR